MTMEKVTQISAKKQLKELRELIKLDENLKKANILEATKILREEVGKQEARRLFLEMSLKFVSDTRNNVDDDEICSLIAIHEILNVM